MNARKPPRRRAKGKLPFGRPTVAVSIETDMRARRTAGTGKLKIARELGMAFSTVLSQISCANIRHPGI
jgi:hypothetical protein